MGAKAFCHLRHATGLSQPAFAKLIGVGVDTVRSIEQERVSVSSRVARSAFIETGVLPISLEACGETLYPEAVAWDRAPYTPSHFEAWKRICAGDLLAGVDGGIPALDRYLNVIKSALCAAGSEYKLGRVQAVLALALFEALFDEELQHSARTRAYVDGRGIDFDVLAKIAGRIERGEEVAP
jgi:transcriptional regulator with XRE-family HTH domain